MNYHIVRTNERVSDIAQAYNLSTEEIISINNHIRSWDKLIPGTKLKLPAIPEQIRIELDDSEPFIEDYYPKIAVEELKATGVNPNDNPSVQDEDKKVEEHTSDQNPNVNLEPKAKASTPSTPVPPYQRPPYPYYPYYQPYYPYYMYPNYQYQYGPRKR